jgi:hypothetical protein
LKYEKSSIVEGEHTSTPSEQRRLDIFICNAGIVDGEDLHRLLPTNCKLQAAGPDRTPKKGRIDERYQVAGAGGIEPPNGGIKIRCLTTWLRPIRPFGNGGDTSVRGFPRVVPVYRERRGISTARRGKLPQAPVAPRHALYGRYAPRSRRPLRHPSCQLRPLPFHGNTAARTVSPGVSHDLPRADL